MISKDVKRLLLKLNDYVTRALEGAAGLAVGRGHYEVTVEHLLVKLLEDGTGDASLILNRLGAEPGRVGKALTDSVERFKTGNAGRPAFSPLLLGLIERAWVAGSVHHGLADVRSGALLEAFLEDDAFATSPVRDAMSPAVAEAVRERFFDLVDGSDENKAARPGARPMSAPGGGETALDLYTHSMTDQAREGGIDPVFGRDREIRQVIDVLSRRRKNNPILVGEAGVGKTAVVEGLALRIVAGDVPESLREAEIAALDLGALQAGAGVKGEFEARMKAVIDAVQEAPRPTILFIDEAHTLVGAGGAAGTGDAANLLKPALARGELRSIAATTWSEYKQHIEKDPALARRFQMVKVDEPGVETAVVMMRGIRDRYEQHHRVQITDAAVRAAVELSDRYLSGRQLPDKAVDLLDTASARVKMSQDATPAALDDVGRRLHEVETEITAIRRDLSAGLREEGEGLDELEAERDELAEKHAALEARWKQEQTAARELDTARQESTAAGGATAGEGVRDLHARLAALQTDGNPLVHAEVGERVVAEVIADWTGIPIGDMVKDEAQMLLELEQRLTERIRGQDEALTEIADALRTAKAGMRKKDAPIGVFLLAGPSGVGKTETARALAELLFGGERFLVSINMSEYQESHTTSQLKGAPPGYVGYGEGGVLTEAVRQRPYSVVLLDEVEKAHIDVMEMFYQVFDRGILRDGEGREVDFSNAVILCTSNVGSDLVQQASMAEEAPSLDTLRTLIHEPLTNHFQPALLGRMNVIPFLSLDREAMAAIARLKLSKVDKRLREAHGIRFMFSDTVVQRIADRCTTIDAGARNIDAIIDRTVLPAASRALLARLAEERMPAALHLGLDAAGDFTYTFVEPGETLPEEADVAMAVGGDGISGDGVAVPDAEARADALPDTETADGQAAHSEAPGAVAETGTEADEMVAGAETADAETADDAEPTA